MLKKRKKKQYFLRTETRDEEISRCATKSVRCRISCHSIDISAFCLVLAVWSVPALVLTCFHTVTGKKYGTIDFFWGRHCASAFSRSFWHASNIPLLGLPAATVWPGSFCGRQQVDFPAKITINLQANLQAIFVVGRWIMNLILLLSHSIPTKQTSRNSLWDLFMILYCVVHVWPKY